VCKTGHNERVQKTRAQLLEEWEVGFLQRRYFTRLLEVRLMFLLRLKSLQVWTVLRARDERGRQIAGLGSWIFRRDAPVREVFQGSYFMYFRSRKELSV